MRGFLSNIALFGARGGANMSLGGKGDVTAVRRLNAIVFASPTPTPQKRNLTSRRVDWTAKSLRKARFSGDERIKIASGDKGGLLRNG